MKIVIGITGASGAIYPYQLLSFFREKTHHDVSIIVTQNGERVYREELNKSLEEFDYPIYNQDDFDSPFVSGSAPFDSLIIVPCSMGTLGRIAHGVSDDVLSRTTDVFLKEKRRVIVVPRETPFSLIHIENMRLLSLAGATIIPAIPSFYSLPQTIETLVFTVTARILDHLGIDNELTKRWKE